MRLRYSAGLIVALAAFPFVALADDARTFVPSSWGQAKRLARNKVYHDRQITFYCNCAYARRGGTGGAIDYSDCPFKPRTDVDRAKRLEWEHVVPASVTAGIERASSIAWVHRPTTSSRS